MHLVDVDGVSQKWYSTFKVNIIATEIYNLNES